MTATTAPSSEIRTHSRDEHYTLTTIQNPNTWTQDERIAAREACSFCRVIFQANGEFKAAGTRREAQEFTTDPRSFNTIETTASTRPAPVATVRHTANVKLASKAQFDFIKSLVTERELEAHIASTVEYMRGRAVKGEMTSREASGLIDVLLTQPKKVVAPTPSPAPEAASPVVPDGRYALRTDDDGVDFFRVESPTTGRWVGRTFVSVQASDELYPLRNQGQRDGILARIAEDVKGASALYGQELGQCGVCGRTLTDDVSRARGIGPVCNDKF